MRIAKILKNKLYLMPSGNLARVVLVDHSKNIVTVYNYHSRRNEIVEFNLAPRLLDPVFKIGEAARMLGRSPETLRRYEGLGKIKEARKVKIGPRNSMRIYSHDDIEELADFFSEQVVGRPSKDARMGRSVNRREISNYYKTRFKEI
jgi:hypothetical protein